MKRFLTLLLCLTLLVSMAALPATSLAEETVELTFYYPVGVGGDLALLIENLAAEFTKENPNIIINPVFCGNSTETTTKTIAAIQGGNAPDFAILGNSELYSMLSLDAIIPLDDLIAADEDGQEYIDDFWPAFLQNSYYDGHIYSIPFQRSTIIMYYNKDAFRAAGLDPETPPTTWEELAEYAQKLTVRDENGNVTQWGVQISTNDPFMFSPFALQNSENGENLMTSDGKTALFNTEGNAEALQFLVDLSQKYQAMPEGVIVWADSTSNFMAGTAAMLYMSSGSLTNVRSRTLILRLAPASCRPASVMALPRAARTSTSSMASATKNWPPPGSLSAGSPSRSVPLSGASTPVMWLRARAALSWMCSRITLPPCPRPPLRAISCSMRAASSCSMTTPAAGIFSKTRLTLP